MEHINVVLQPGERRDLAANGRVWINVTDEEQPRVGLGLRAMRPMPRMADRSRNFAARGLDPPRGVVGRGKRLVLASDTNGARALRQPVQT